MLNDAAGSFKGGGCGESSSGGCLWGDHPLMGSCGGMVLVKPSLDGTEFGTEAPSCLQHGIMGRKHADRHERHA